MKHGLPQTPVREHRLCAPWTYFTYPHCNGFTSDGRALVLGRCIGDRIQLIRRDLADGHEDELISFPVGTTPNALWYDISLETDRLAIVADNRILVADLAGGRSFREVHRGQDGWMVHSIPSISGDGRRLAIGETRQDGSPHGATRIRELDLASGVFSDLFSYTFNGGHIHYCPADEAWIGYCHEGDTTGIPDRLWGWHREREPHGRCLFDQASDVPGSLLCVGHERWCYHSASAVVVAYGASPHGPRGIYEVPVVGRSRLISGGDRDWHVNISRDGRQMILDTTGSLDCAGCGWANGDGRSDVVLVDVDTGRRSWLTRTHEAGLRFTLPRNHPWHPHPHLGPDGHLAVFNDFGADAAPAVSLIRF